MKTRITTVLLALAMGAAAFAQESTGTTKPNPSPVVKAADAVIVRPICFASTVVGSALFVLSLPVTAPLKKTKSTADMLVVKPANATFKRPLGDMDAMAD